MSSSFQCHRGDGSSRLEPPLPPNNMRCGSLDSLRDFYDKDPLIHTNNTHSNTDDGEYNHTPLF